MKTEIVKKMIHFKTTQLMRGGLAFLLILALNFLEVQSLVYAAPKRISYQGRLTNAQNIPINGTFNIHFIIEDDNQAEQWSDTISGINVSNGVFFVELGSPAKPISASIFDIDELYLKVIMNGPSGQPLDPPQRLLASPYALSAERVKWGDIMDIPDDIANGDDVGLISVAWGDIPDIPSDIADGDNVGVSNSAISKMIAFFPGNCPSGWTEHNDSKGRIIVGLPALGTPLETVGTPLTNKQEITHLHQSASHNHGNNDTISATSEVFSPDTNTQGDHSHNSGSYKISDHDHNTNTSSVDTDSNDNPHTHGRATSIAIGQTGDNNRPHKHEAVIPNNSTEDDGGTSSVTGSAGNDSGHSHGVKSHGHGISGSFNTDSGFTAVGNTGTPSLSMPYIQLRACKRN